MADDTLQVAFGASTDDLDAGAKRASEAIGGVSDSVNKLGEKLNHLAEAFGVAFSIEGIKTFVESMAELGLNTERTAATLGLSNQQVVELSGFAKLTGTDIQSLSMGIERMSLNIQRSTRDGINPQAQALKVLGLNARELIGLPADQWFLKLADAVSRFNPSLNLTNAVMAVGGRNVAQMMPALLKGADGFKQFQEEVQKASEGLAQAIPGMADTHEKLTLLGISAQSLGARLFSAVKPAIDAVVVSMTNWIQSFHQDDIRDAANDIGNALVTIAQQVALFFVGAEEDYRKFVSVLESGAPAVHAAGAAALFAVGQVGMAVDQLKQAAQGVGTVTPFAAIEADADAARVKVNAFADSARTALNASVPSSQSFGSRFGAMMGLDTLDADLARWQSDIAGAGKQNATAINQNGAEMVAAMQSHYQEMITQIDGFYNRQKEELSAALAQHRVTYAQETADLLQALDARHAGEDAAYANEAAAMQAAGKNYEAILKEKLAADQKYALERQQIIDKAAKEEEAVWKSAADTIAGAFNSQLQKLLAGTETWKQAMMKISGDLILKFIEDQIKLTAEFLAQQAQKLAATIATQAGMTSATTAGEAVRSAAETMGGQSSILSVIANAFKSIGASAGQADAAAAAFSAPFVGPAAPAVGAAAGSAVMASAMSFMGGFEIGSWSVPATGLAVLHQNEMVIPSRGGFADEMRAAVGRGFGQTGAGAGGITKSDMRGLLADHREQMDRMMRIHRLTMSGMEDEIRNLRRKIR